jgi:RNA polymerase primary sigma factor
MALKDTDDAKPEEQEADVSLDMSQAAVKKMIADARERGYITYEQLNTVLPPEQVSSEQIEDVMSMLSEMGINVIEDDEAEEGEVGGELVETSSTSREVAVVGATTETLDRTDDPVRMYLREMGSVELLSREGEIPRWMRWTCPPPPRAGLAAAPSRNLTLMATPSRVPRKRMTMTKPAPCRWPRWKPR